MKCEVLKVYDDYGYTCEIVPSENKVEALKIADEILKNEKDKLFSLDVYYIKIMSITRALLSCILKENI